MAILFEWYENPVAPNQPQEETKLHARITLNGKTGTDRLRRKIQERCSLTETDVNKGRYKTEEYESKAERHQIPGGSGTEK